MENPMTPRGAVYQGGLYNGHPDSLPQGPIRIDAPTRSTRLPLQNLVHTPGMLAPNTHDTGPLPPSSCDVDPQDLQRPFAQDLSPQSPRPANRVLQPADIVGHNRYDNLPAPPQGLRGAEARAALGKQAFEVAKADFLHALEPFKQPDVQTPFDLTIEEVVPYKAPGLFKRKPKGLGEKPFRLSDYTDGGPKDGVWVVARRVKGWHIPDVTMNADITSYPHYSTQVKSYGSATVGADGTVWGGSGWYSNKDPNNRTIAIVSGSKMSPEKLKISGMENIRNKLRTLATYIGIPPQGYMHSYAYPDRPHPNSLQPAAQVQVPQRRRISAHVA